MKFPEIKGLAQYVTAAFEERGDEFHANILLWSIFEIMS